MKFHPKHQEIEQFYNKPYLLVIGDLYASGLSTYEISEKIKAEADIYMSPRGVNRALLSAKVWPRQGKEAFNNAYRRGRISSFRQPHDSLIYSTMRRKGFKCCVCGSPSSNASLTGIFIVEPHNGGDRTSTNVAIICETHDHEKVRAALSAA